MRGEDSEDGEDSEEVRGHCAAPAVHEVTGRMGPFRMVPGSACLPAVCNFAGHSTSTSQWCRRGVPSSPAAPLARP